MLVKKKEKMQKDQKIYKEVVLPFEWEDWDEQDINISSYYNVRFFEDFGRIKFEDRFKSLLIDYQHGFIEAYDEKDEVIIRQYFKGIPCESKNNIP